MPRAAKFAVGAMALILLLGYAALALLADAQTQAAAGFVIAGFGGLWASIGELRAHRNAARDRFATAMRLLGFAGLTLGSMLNALPAAIAAATLSATLGRVLFLAAAVGFLITVPLYFVARAD